MMQIGAPVLALALALAEPRHKRKRHPSPSGPAARAQRSALVALLALRGEMLHDFLVRAGTESPALLDRRIIRVADGVDVGPTIVTVDFLGSPTVRASVRNASVHVQDLLLSVRARDERGGESRASAWVERLAPGETRAIELFCPAALEPRSVDWSATAL